MVTGFWGHGAERIPPHPLVPHRQPDRVHDHGLGLFGLTASPTLAVLALAGSVFYIIHHIIVKTNLFLVSGIAFRMRGHLRVEGIGRACNCLSGLGCLVPHSGAVTCGLAAAVRLFRKIEPRPSGPGTPAVPIVAVAWRWAC